MSEKKAFVCIKQKFFLIYIFFYLKQFSSFQFQFILTIINNQIKFYVSNECFYNFSTFRTANNLHHSNFKNVTLIKVQNVKMLFFAYYFKIMLRLLPEHCKLNWTRSESEKERDFMCSSFLVSGFSGFK